MADKIYGMQTGHQTALRQKFVSGPRVHFMHIGLKIFGIYLTFCWRSDAISSMKSVLDMVAFENQLTLV